MGQNEKVSGAGSAPEAKGYDDDDIKSSTHTTKNGGRKQAPESKPKTFCGDLHHLPTALAPLVNRPHWVLWRWEKPKDKFAKVPYQPSGRRAKNNDPTTWSGYDVVLRTMVDFDGIGFCLFESDISAFDIDHCRDPTTGAIDSWASDLVERVGSYTEITVSGTGLRIIGHGVGPKLHRKLPVNNGVTLEAYRRAERYIVITGNPLPNSNGIINIDVHIDATVAELDAKKAHAEQNKPGTPEDGGHHERQQGGDEDELWQAINTDVPVGQRSEKVWWVINEMFRRGYRVEAVLATLLDRRNKISAHIYDQQKPQEYAERQIAEARSKVRLTESEKGEIFKTPSNICVALLKLGVTLRYDRFADRMLINGLPDFGPVLEDSALDRLWLILDRRFRLRPTKDLLRTVVSDVARLNGFHPVKDYLDGLRWDGVKRIDKWLIDYGGAEDTEYSHAVSALMLVAAVRRVRRPGCKFDEMVVIENEDQGTDKSTMLATLAVRDDWFSDDLPLNISGKQVVESLRGRWIVEAAELSGMRRADVEHLKAFLSRQIDRARMAYGHFVTEVPRQCIIVGTTNAVEYLKDTSGNRRFWPVRVKKFDIAALRRDRDQLWAEAAQREVANASIRLDPKLWRSAEEEQEQRLTRDPWYDALQSALSEMEGRISSMSLWEILDVRGAQRTQDQSRRLSDAMRHLGWRRANKARTIKVEGTTNRTCGEFAGPKIAKIAKPTGSKL
jgi:hypothetical protein